MLSTEFYYLNSFKLMHLLNTLKVELLIFSYFYISLFHLENYIKFSNNSGACS